VFGDTANVAAHVEAVRRLGKSPVLAVNTHAGDPGDAFAVIAEHAETWSVPVVATDAYARGGAGAEALARAVIAAASDAPVRHPYELSDPPRAKLLAIATQIYGARDVVWTATAERELEATLALGGATWPVCVAKTQWSLSDEATHVGRPADFVITVRGVSPAAGAGFWVARCGDINLMPGLGRHPRAFDP